MSCARHSEQRTGEKRRVYPDRYQVVRRPTDSYATRAGSSGSPHRGGAPGPGSSHGRMSRRSDLGHFAESRCGPAAPLHRTAGRRLRLGGHSPTWSSAGASSVPHARLSGAPAESDCSTSSSTASSPPRGWCRSRAGVRRWPSEVGRGELLPLLRTRTGVHSLCGDGRITVNPAQATGWQRQHEQTEDELDDQRPGVQGTHHGALLVDGSLACPAVPTSLPHATTEPDEAVLLYRTVGFAPVGFSLPGNIGVKYREVGLLRPSSTSVDG